MAPHQATHGWLLALSSTGLAASAHGAAGGGIPDTVLIVPLLVLIAWGGAALADRLRRLVVLVPVLGLIQLGLHLLLAQSVHSHPAMPAPNGVAMFAGHTVATVLTAALLARASAPLALIASAIDWLREALVALRQAAAPAPVALGPVSAVPARPGALLEVHLRRAHARRGPPARS